jgi:hypothetical protein
MKTMHASMRTGLQIALVVGGGIFFSAQASADDTTTGLDSLAGGTQVMTAVSAPVTVSGNAISVVGDSRSTHRPAATGSGHTGSTKAGSASTSGEDSVAGGTQVVAPVTAPVTVGGNAVSVLGDSTATTPADPSDPVTPVDPSDPVIPADPSDPVTPADPSDPVTPTAIDPATSGSGPEGSVGVLGTMTRTATTMAAAAPALSRLAQTGAATGLLVGAALLLLLVGGLLTVVGRRTDDPQAA